MVPVFRAPMRARDVELPPGAGAEYGLTHGLVGIGHGEGDKAARMLHRFVTVPEGAFVWTRDRIGVYHLGAIAGSHREDHSFAARAVGIVHVRPATWLRRGFSDGEVPPAVAQTFARGGRNFQQTHDRDAERITADLWARDQSG